MTKTDISDRLIVEGNEYLQTSAADEACISRNMLLDYVKKRNLERVAHGVYMSKDAWHDGYYLLYLRNKRIIFSGASALYLHEMAGSETFHMTVTVPEGYKASHLTKKQGDPC